MFKDYFEKKIVFFMGKKHSPIRKKYADAMLCYKISHFRSEVFRRSTKCFGCVAELNVLLAEAEVSNLDVAVLVEQQVFKLEEII
jgi:hypothetical protein